MFLSTVALALVWWDWRLEGSGFHRRIVFSSHCLSSSCPTVLLVEFALPSSVFVDLFEERRAMGDRSTLDVESRADAASPQTVWFLVETGDELRFTVHLRYAAPSHDGADEARVVLRHIARVWDSRGTRVLSAADSKTVETSIPCGRASDAGWVLATTAATALVGALLMISRMRR